MPNDKLEVTSRYIAPRKGRPGYLIVLTLGIASVLILLTIALVSFAARERQLGSSRKVRSSTLDVSEAGLNYYLWHLSHNPTDYTDGTGHGGPYVHQYRDVQGNLLGQFSLSIDPPAPGSTTVKVTSTGTLNNSTQKKIVQAQIGVPSFARYAVVSNDNLRFGTSTETFGPLMANGGIRFDGIAHDVVSSAKQTYTDPDTGLQEPGVWTSQPNENNVFLAGKQFPVPAVDFTQLTTDLSNLKTKGSSSDGKFYAYRSDKLGYHIVLKNNQTFDIYTVSATSSQCGGQNTDQVRTQQLLASNVAYPANGVIFVEHKLWIDGQINGNRLTIGAARFPENPNTYASIVINNDLKYTFYDGTDSLGLIAQNNILVGLFSEGSFSGTADQQELRIDGALLAQKGRVGRNYFAKSCDSTYWQRNKLTLYGSIGTFARYGFSWICGGSWDLGDSCDSGYYIRTLTYDQNLTFNPPPSFPTTGSYAILSWQQIQ